MDKIPVKQNDASKEAFSKWKGKTFFVVLRQFKKNKLAMFGLTIILLLVIIAIFAPWIT